MNLRDRREGLSDAVGLTMNFIGKERKKKLKHIGFFFFFLILYFPFRFRSSLRICKAFVKGQSRAGEVVLGVRR